MVSGSTTTIAEIVTMGPDVGPISGACGFLDFFINGELHWDIELLRDGDSLREHG